MKSIASIKNFISTKELLYISYIFLATRVAVLLIGVVSFAIFPQRGEVYSRREVSEVVNIQNVWDKWDSYWYQKLANEGYPQKQFSNETKEAWGFMPLYSLIINLVSKIFGNNYFWIGFVLSNIFSFLGIILIYKFFKEKYFDAKNAIRLLLVSAASFYLSIVYTEGLYLFLSALVFYLTYKKKLSLALIIAGLATITRIQGFLLFIIPIFEIYKLYKFNIKKYILPIILSSLPLLFLMIYLFLTSGEPLAFIKIQKAWGSYNLYPLQGFTAFFTGAASLGAYINTLFWIFYLLIIFLNYKKLELSYIVFSLAIFLLSTSNDTIWGSPRYILPVIPIYIALIYSNKNLSRAYIYLNTLFLAISIAAFVTNTPA